jgi:hypothetical protein
MKNLICFILLGLIGYLPVMAQNPVNDPFVNQYRTNLAAPDISAYKALQIDPSKILRPSNTKEISLIVGDLFRNGNILIPEALGIEIAPWLLASRKTLAEYRQSSMVRFLHRTSFSVATKRDNAGDFTSRIAFGVKTSFVSKEGDVKMDTKRLEEIFRRQAITLKTRNEYLMNFLKEKGYTPDKMDNPEVQAEFDTYVKERFNEEEPLNEYISKVVEDFKQKNWNHRRLDIAFTFTGSSRDTTINLPPSNELRYETLSLWATAALPVKKWGQLLIGTQAEFVPERKDSLQFQIALPVRLYAGTNRIKGFAETQVTFTDTWNNYLFNAGTEFNIRDGFWINLSAGISTSDFENPVMVSHFDIRFTIPEKFKLF